VVEESEVIFELGPELLRCAFEFPEVPVMIRFHCCEEKNWRVLVVSI